jgi:rhomboid protease GluP
MSASGQQVFKESQYWRLWTALFAHADLGHLLGNLSLMLPLSYILTSYFGFLVFPVLGILLGGLINFWVIQTMPLEVQLIGISGVVYWMGAVWLTLFMLIDRRKTLRRRMALAMFLTVVLFIPDTYKPQISYLSHFIGYVLGVVTGVVVYIFRRKEFEAAEIKELIIDDPEDGFIEGGLATESLNDVPPVKSVRSTAES